MKMRKGFTLVELLIVIIIIGILAAAMLMSSGSATTSAQASTVVSEMRALKAAVIMTVGDMGGVADMAEADVNTAIAIDKMAEFMEKPDDVKNGKYTITYKAASGVVSIEPDQTGTKIKTGVLEKVKLNKAVNKAKGDMGFPILKIN